MRGVIWGMVVLVGVAVISLSPYAIAAADVPRITAEELYTKLNDPDVIILDVVRYGTDWVASDQKIPGAVREDPKDVKGWAGKYPHDKTLVIYCA